MTKEPNVDKTVSGSCTKQDAVEEEEAQGAPITAAETTRVRQEETTVAGISTIKAMKLPGVIRSNEQPVAKKGLGGKRRPTKETKLVGVRAIKTNQASAGKDRKAKTSPSKRRQLAKEKADTFTAVPIVEDPPQPGAIAEDANAANKGRKALRGLVKNREDTIASRKGRLLQQPGTTEEGADTAIDRNKNTLTQLHPNLEETIATINAPFQLPLDDSSSKASPGLGMNRRPDPNKDVSVAPVGMQEEPHLQEEYDFSELNDVSSIIPQNIDEEYQANPKPPGTADTPQLNLAIAQPVLGSSRLDLPTTMEVENDQHKIAARRKFQRHMAACLLLGLAIIGAIVGTTVGLMDGGEESLIIQANTNSANTTEAPTTPIIEEFLETRFPFLFRNETYEAINNSTSPQALAYEWLIGDPNITHYSDERIRQRFALVTFYYATNGNNWRENADWLSYSVHECNWYSQSSLQFQPELRGIGVCDSLSNFTQSNDTLNHLWLDDNELDGELPLEMFYYLTSLESFSLNWNAVNQTAYEEWIKAGENPDEFWETSKRTFTRPLPTQIALLQNLQKLHIVGNGCCQGSIPSEIAVLSLKTIDIGTNYIGGNLPSELGKLKALQHLDLSRNGLTGTLPSELVQLQALQHLDLSYNHRLKGTLASDLGKLQALQHLDLSYNRLKGTLPSDLGKLQALQQLDLSNNYYLTGSLPSELGQLETLQHLDLSSNYLTGTLPSELSQLEVLKTLRFFSTNIFGVVSDNLCLLDMIEFDCSDQLCGCRCGLCFVPIYLTNGQALAIQSPSAVFYHFAINGTVPSGSFASCSLQADNGDADLVVYFENDPNYDCIRERAVSHETCTIGPAMSNTSVYASVYASEAYTELTITCWANITIPSVENVAITLTSGIALANQSGVVNMGTFYTLSESVEVGDYVTCSIAGDNGNADLAVYFENDPGNSYCESVGVGSFESCTVGPAANDIVPVVYIFASDAYIEVTITCWSNSTIPSGFAGSTEYAAIPLTSGIALTNQSGVADMATYYKLSEPVQGGDYVTCSIEGYDGDVELHVYFQNDTDNTCISPGIDSFESCTVGPAADGTVAVAFIFAYEAYTKLTIACWSNNTFPSEYYDGSTEYAAIPLTSGIALTNQSGVADMATYYKLSEPVQGGDYVTCSIEGYDGDVELHVNFENDTDNYCGAGVSCTVRGPAANNTVPVVYIFASDAYTELTITCWANITIPSGYHDGSTEHAAIPLTSGVALTNQSSGEYMFTYYYKLSEPVQVGDYVTCSSEGDNGDADLLVYFGDGNFREFSFENWFDATSNGCHSGGIDSFESCTIGPAASSTVAFAVVEAYFSYIGLSVECVVHPLLP